MNNTADILIVGGAITGSTIAYFLKAKMGFDGSVVVVEKDKTYQHSSTTLSAASIRQQYSTEINISMSQYSIEFFRNIRSHLGEEVDIGLTENGYLLLWNEAAMDVLERSLSLQLAHGVDVEQLSQKDMLGRWHWLQTSDLACGTYGRSGEGSFDAYSLLSAVRKAAQRAGVEYVDGEVVTLHRDASRIHSASLADGRTIKCAELVNASGPAAAGVAAMAGIELPVECRKRSVFVVHCRELEFVRDCPLVIDAGGVWFRPEGQYFICGVAPPEENDPICTDHIVNHELFEEVIWPSLANRVPTFEAVKVVNSWAGHYAVNTLDHNAILGRHPKLNNFVLANGFSGHGLQHAPSVGLGIAELLCHGEYRTLDLSPLGWERIANNRPMRELNVF